MNICRVSLTCHNETSLSRQIIAWRSNDNHKNCNNTKCVKLEVSNPYQRASIGLDGKKLTHHYNLSELDISWTNSCRVSLTGHTEHTLKLANF